MSLRFKTFQSFFFFSHLCIIYSSHSTFFYLILNMNFKLYKGPHRLINEVRITTFVHTPTEDLNVRKICIEDIRL